MKLDQLNSDDVEQVRTRWCNGSTPERAEVLILGHGSEDSPVFVQVKGGNEEILLRTLSTPVEAIITYQGFDKPECIF